MSVKNSRAARLNKVMMISTMFLGVVVIGCVIFFMSYAFSGQEAQQGSDEPTALGMGDSLVINVSDSLLLE